MTCSRMGIIAENLVPMPSWDMTRARLPPRCWHIKCETVRPSPNPA